MWNSYHFALFFLSTLAHKQHTVFMLGREKMRQPFYYARIVVRLNCCQTRNNYMQINSVDFILFVNIFCVKCTFECTRTHTYRQRLSFLIYVINVMDEWEEEREKTEININHLCKMYLNGTLLQKVESEKWPWIDSLLRISDVFVCVLRMVCRLCLFTILFIHVKHPLVRSQCLRKKCVCAL